MDESDDVHPSYSALLTTVKYSSPPWPLSPVVVSPGVLSSESVAYASLYTLLAFYWSGAFGLLLVPGVQAGHVYHAFVVGFCIMLTKACGFFTDEFQPCWSCAAAWPRWTVRLVTTPFQKSASALDKRISGLIWLVEKKKKHHWAHLALQLEPILYVW